MCETEGDSEKTTGLVQKTVTIGQETSLWIMENKHQWFKLQSFVDGRATNILKGTKL